MTPVMGSLALAYLAGSGTVTNATIVGRGLVRAAACVVQGDFRQAGAEAVAALAAPALVSYATTAAFVMEIARTANLLASPAVGDEGAVAA